MRRQANDPAVLITNIAQTREREFTHRRRRYSFMMAMRVVCVVAAAVVYALSPWLSLALIVAAAVLPWCAVLLANDRPPKRTPPTREMLLQTRERALGSGDDSRTVDG